MEYRLIQATISGIKNIEKPISIDFMNKYPTKKDLSSANIKAIYGPNGSGKTAIVTAFHFYKNLVLNNTFLSNNDIPFEKLINHDTKVFEMIVSFMSFLTNKTYKHHIKVDFSKNTYRVTEEHLYILGRRKEEKEILRFVDSTNELEVISFNDYASSIKGILPSSLSTMILFHMIDENKDKEFNKLRNYAALYLFASSLTVFFGEKSDSPNYLAKREKDEVQEIENLNSVYKSMQKYDDDEYDAIVLKSKMKDFNKKLKRLTDMVKLMKPELKEIKPDPHTINSELQGINYIFVYSDTDYVPIKYESTGIRKIVKLFDTFIAAHEGSIVFIDEIDADIHDVFLCNLLDYFTRYTKVQMIITTHNVDIMNNIKSLKHSIDFISDDNVYTAWVKNGTYSPKNVYLSGMVSHIPFNLLSSDFIPVFQGDYND